MICLGLGLFGVLWAMTRLANTAFDATVTGYLIGGLVLIGVFVLIERRVVEPMLPLSIFRVPTMSASLLASRYRAWSASPCSSCSSCTCRAARSFPHPRLAAARHGYVLGSVAVPYAGRLADRRGPVLPATAGLAIQVASLAIYAQLTVTTGLWGGGAGEHQ